MSKQQIRLVFEGGEATGKSSIAKALSKHIGIPYYKDSYQKQLSPLVKQLWDFIKQTDQSIIIDRDFPSYWVYANYYNSPIDDKSVYEMDALAADLGTKIIFCFKDNYTQYNDVVPIEANKKLKELYLQFAEITKCEYLILNTDDMDLEKQIQKIMDWLRK